LWPGPSTTPRGGPVLTHAKFEWTLGHRINCLCNSDLISRKSGHVAQLAEHGDGPAILLGDMAHKWPFQVGRCSLLMAGHSRHCIINAGKQCTSPCSIALSVIENEEREVQGKFPICAVR